jgi:hypothetical protein
MNQQSKCFFQNIQHKLLFVTLCLLLPAASESFAQRAMSDDILEKYESYQRPKRKFRFAKKSNINALKAMAELPVDTNSVYISSSFFSHQNVLYYRYTRCFSNGEVFISHTYKTPPSDQECNDLTYGNWGMYSIKGTDVIIEVYVRGFPSRYWYNYAKCEGDKLKYYKWVEGRVLSHTQTVDTEAIKRRVSINSRRIPWN